VIKPAYFVAFGMFAAAATVCYAEPPGHNSNVIRLATASYSAAGVLPSPAMEAIPGNSYELKQLAPGVYAAIRRVTAGSADGNSMFIINDSDVIVVDTGGYRADARQVIAEIKKLTDKPVRYVINTHSHGDHISGDEIYREAFPAVEFICHANAREQILHNPGAEKSVPLFQAEIANVQKRLDSGKESDGTPLTSARRAHLNLAKANFEFWISDMKDSHQIVPALSISDGLVLHRGERSIEIKYLGNGHTNGDLIVFLPKEKIVATGDLIVDPIPFGFSTTLHDWPATLQALKKLNATTILPGHGEIESDWSYVDRQIALFESTWQQVKKAVDGGADLEATHKQVDGDALWKVFGAPSSESRDEFNYEFLDPAIDAAFKVLRPGPAT
jgi:cyclase